ncbi:MAG: hypothetical protein ACRDRA_21375 [Pseudonocardiaceae bacterium]
MSDQAGLFDLPDPVPSRPPTRSGRGRAWETFARTVMGPHWAADPHAPLAAIPGVTWTSVEGTVKQVLSRPR